MNKIETITGQGLREMFESATVWLEKCAPDVDALNVFPVPDGDTGTNMLLTMRSCIEESYRAPDRSASAMAEAMAKGALMGARGNSGVILSQIWRGLADGVAEKESLTDCPHCDIDVFGYTNKIASYSYCQHGCDYFKEIDYKNKTVKCSYLHDKREAEKKENPYDFRGKYSDEMMQKFKESCESIVEHNRNDEVCGSVLCVNCPADKAYNGGMPCYVW